MNRIKINPANPVNPVYCPKAYNLFAMQLLDQIQHLRFPAQLPETLLEVHQTFDAPRVDDIPLAVRKALEDGGLLAQIKPGDSVAVGVGSRGIANIAKIARAAVERRRDLR